MSCKYCELKRRKDDDVEWLAGEDWESDSDDGGYICPNDDGFRMLVYYDARCACTAVDNIKYCPFCGAKLAMPKEPLIKDEKIRKAVRAWAEMNGIETVLVCQTFNAWGFKNKESGKAGDKEYMLADILFRGEKPEELEFCKEYAIPELCGEEQE